MSEGVAVSRIETAGADDLWFIAGESGLTTEECQAIIARADEETLGSLASNQEAPEEIIGRLAAYPDPVGEAAKTNPSAPVVVKDQLPLGAHSNASIASYLEQRQASPEEARHIADAYKKAPHLGGPLLGEVWAEASTR